MSNCELNPHCRTIVPRLLSWEMLCTVTIQNHLLIPIHMKNDGGLEKLRALGKKIGCLESVQVLSLTTEMGSLIPQQTKAEC